MNKLKRWCRSKAGKRIFAVLGAIVVMCSMSLSAFAVGEVAGGYDGAAAVAAAKEVFSAATGTLSIANLALILSAGVGVAAGLFLVWFGVRKLIRLVTAGIKNGRVKA